MGTWQDEYCEKIKTTMFYLIFKVLNISRLYLTSKLA